LYGPTGFKPELLEVQAMNNDSIILESVSSANQIITRNYRWRLRSLALNSDETHPYL
jgi:hypothetical protein